MVIEEMFGTFPEIGPDVVKFPVTAKFPVVVTLPPNVALPVTAKSPPMVCVLEAPYLGEFSKMKKPRNMNMIRKTTGKMIFFIIY